MCPISKGFIAKSNKTPPAPGGLLSLDSFPNANCYCSHRVKFRRDQGRAEIQSYLSRPQMS